MLAALMPFAGRGSNDMPDDALPFALPDYIELVDWTGRAVRDGQVISIVGGSQTAQVQIAS